MFYTVLKDQFTFGFVTVNQRTSSTLLSNALQNEKSLINKSSTSAPGFTDLQGRGERGSGRAPIGGSAVFFFEKL